MMIAGFAVSKPPVAWLGLALAGATREDGGFHALAFTLAALACSLSGRRFPIERGTLIRMAIAAAAMSAAAVFVQNFVFESAGTFGRQFLGQPALGHLTPELLQRRLLSLPLRTGFVVFPMIGSVVVAALARDARYLLGWVAELPWMLVCVLALSEGKGALGTYNGFPLVASIFWVGAYGQIGRPLLGRQPWLVVLAALSGLATLGGFLSHPNPFRSTLWMAAVPTDVAYAGIAQFARGLERREGFYGNVLVDPGVASWALGGVSAEQCVPSLMKIVSPHSYEGIAFFRGGAFGPQMERFIKKSPFSQCGQIPTSEVFLCTRPSHALPSPFVMASLER
jgi:hypothetical protein